MIATPLKLYKYYGDIDILKIKHTAMLEYMEYLKKRANGRNYLDDGGLGDRLTLGR